MVKKLKCWTRFGVHHVKHKGTKKAEGISVLRNPARKGKKIAYQVWKLKGMNMDLISGSKILTKRQAESLAQGYMKKHDIC